MYLSPYQKVRFFFKFYVIFFLNGVTQSIRMNLFYHLQYFFWWFSSSFCFYRVLHLALPVPKNACFPSQLPSRTFCYKKSFNQSAFSVVLYFVDRNTHIVYFYGTGCHFNLQVALKTSQLCTAYLVH